MLGVLDAEPAVARTIQLHRLLEHSKNHLVGTVANRVDCNLKASLVGIDDSAEQPLRRNHLVARQPAG